MFIPSRSCSAHRDRSTAEICSGQASSGTECVCLTAGPLNMDPLTEFPFMEEEGLTMKRTGVSLSVSLSRASPRP
ncbi:hypothetical protein QQF64_033477 [Cirrhinus molitorella]|uniref:Uncharacterized protein n=1 Tax=Cirrhinus molitorella TaxID=172907 RepID=A0ABR3MU05_9TELE